MFALLPERINLMIAKPNLDTYYLARGWETGVLTVSQIWDGGVLWRGEYAHCGAITDLAWSPDGQWLASGGLDGMVRVWQAESGYLLQAFPHGDAVQRLRWSARGTLASSSGATIHLWSLALSQPALAA
jgi:WD40 repeat protein